jgi:hypothetical protein
MLTTMTKKQRRPIGKLSSKQSVQNGACSRPIQRYDDKKTQQ